MNKLIFLLVLALAMVRMVSAVGSAYPSGDLPLDGVMSEYGADGFAVTPDTVPVDMLFEQPAGFLSLPDFYMINVPAGKPQSYPLVEPITAKGQWVFIPPKQGDYWLRL